ncbi:MAG: thioredoxin domain-containing protein, partial [Gaiellaceae bacterium]
GHALCALDFHFSPPRELAVIGSPADAVAQRHLAPFEPNSVIAFGPDDDVPLLQGKDYVSGRPAVYICENFACRAPAI